MVRWQSGAIISLSPLLPLAAYRHCQSHLWALRDFLQSRKGCLLWAGRVLALASETGARFQPSLVSLSCVSSPPLGGPESLWHQVLHCWPKRCSRGADWGLRQSPGSSSETWLCLLWVRGTKLLLLNYFSPSGCTVQEARGTWGAPVRSPPGRHTEGLRRAPLVNSRAIPRPHSSLILEPCWWYFLLKLTQVTSRMCYDWAKQK